MAGSDNKSVNENNENSLWKNNIDYDTELALIIEFYARNVV